MNPRLAYAANRHIGLAALRMLLERDIVPVALLAPAQERASFVDEMRALLPPTTPVLLGKAFKTAAGIDVLRGVQPDYLLSVHFPYVFPAEVLAIPGVGSLNLHPAYLPFNRGWHTPSWAILDGTPIGATLHWIDTGIDTGDIAAQVEVEVSPGDTADTLYKRVLAAELDLFEQSIPAIVARSLPRSRQASQGSVHAKADLAAVQELRLDERMEAGALLRKLRALSTSNPTEHAYFREAGRIYRVQIAISDEKGG